MRQRLRARPRLACWTEYQLPVRSPQTPVSVHALSQQSGILWPLRTPPGWPHLFLLMSPSLSPMRLAERYSTIPGLSAGKKNSVSSAPGEITNFIEVGGKGRAQVEFVLLGGAMLQNLCESCRTPLEQ